MNRIDSVGMGVLGATDLGVIAVVAAVVSAALVVALKPVLVRYALARPNARSSHRTPTPQGGGIAVIAAIFVGVLAAVAMSVLDRTAIYAYWPLAVAIVLLGIVGAIDDIRTIPVLPRLFLQFVAVTAVMALVPADWRILPVVPWWIERALAIIAGVYFVNLVNFMDGIDWMSVAEVVPLAFGVAILGSLGTTSPFAIVAATALAGAMLGFAPFNRPVAKLFLGDVGSLPIGLLVFWLLLDLAMRGHLAAAVLLPLYYLADATLTIARRLIAGERITQAHRSHFYQRALDRGWRVVDVVARVFAVDVVLVALAVATVLVQSRLFDAAAVVLGAAAVTWLLATLAAGKR
jgi:UDP-N-acetylmuramyl pentapeptide phosphotransferase/UDP-N-acetylglucosamine-1-phosphate transferase